MYRTVFITGGSGPVSRTTLVPGDPVEVFVSLAHVFLGLTWFLGPVGQEGLRELCRLYAKEGE